MASAKDIYEAKVYGANIYAAGVFRGVGVTVDPKLGLEYSVGHGLIHYTVPLSLVHFTAPRGLVHFTAPNEDLGG